MRNCILRTATLGLLSAALVWSSATGALAEKFKAVTTFTVIADIAQNVAGDAAIVELLRSQARRFTITSLRPET